MHKVQIVVLDSSSINIKVIPLKVVKELKKNPAYNYMENAAPPQTLWDKFLDWFWKKVEALFGNKAGNLTIQIILYSLSIAALVFIIVLLFKNNARALFYGKSASAKLDFVLSEENIHEIDFDKRIDDEVQKRDFRKAVRFYFLKIIKELHKQSFITWKQDKTNADYLKELNNSQHYHQFKELSKLYEYIWYGDFKLNEPDFMQVIKKFDQFRINNSTDVKRR